MPKQIQQIQQVKQIEKIIEEIEEIEKDECNLNDQCGEIVKLAMKSPPTDDQIDAIADFFYVLSDKTRLKIINILESGDLCVGHIAETLGMTQSAVSHQLAIMKRLNLIKAKKDGRNTIYSLSDEHINIVFDIAFKHVCE